MPTEFCLRRHVAPHQPQAVESVQLTIKKAVTERVGPAHFRPKGHESSGFLFVKNSLT